MEKQEIFGIEMSITNTCIPNARCFTDKRRMVDRLVNCIDTDENIAGAFGKHLAYPNANPYTIRDINKHFEGFNTKNKTYFLEDQKKYDIMKAIGNFFITFQTTTQ